MEVIGVLSQFRKIQCEYYAISSRHINQATEMDVVDLVHSIFACWDFFGILDESRLVNAFSGRAKFGFCYSRDLYFDSKISVWKNSSG